MLHLRSLLLVTFSAALLHACGNAGPQQPKEPDVSGVQRLLPGEYVGRMSRGDVYHKVAKLNVPAFGGTIFYHHISLDSAGGPALQRKFYRFDEGGARMKSTVLLGTGDVFTDTQSLEETLANMPEDKLLRFPDACKISWSVKDGAFVGQVFREDCQYDSPAFGGPVSPEMTYRVTQCAFAINEAIYRENGEPVFPPSSAVNARMGREDC